MRQQHAGGTGSAQTAETPSDLQALRAVQNPQRLSPLPRPPSKARPPPLPPAPRSRQAVPTHPSTVQEHFLPAQNNQGLELPAQGIS